MIEWILLLLKYIWKNKNKELLNKQFVTLIFLFFLNKGIEYSSACESGTKWLCTMELKMKSSPALAD